MKIQSNNYFIPIPIILVLTYYLTIKTGLQIHYHNCFGELLIGRARFYGISFLVGALATNIQLSILFAQEVNDLATKHDDFTPPTFYEPIGYILKIIWGGISAVIFVLAIKQGFLASFDNINGDLNMESNIVVSFVVGLRAFAILKKISGIIK